MTLRKQVEAIIAEGDAMSWDASKGPAAAEAHVDAELGRLVAGRVEAAVHAATATPAVIVEVDTPPPVDPEAERATLGFLMLLQPGDPTRVRRAEGLHYPPDFGCSPGAIWATLTAAEFFDPFNRWLFDAMRDASRQRNWATYIMGRRSEAADLGADNLAVVLKRLGDGLGHWSALPYWLARVQQAARRRNAIARGRTIIAAATRGFRYGVL